MVWLGFLLWWSLPAAPEVSAPAMPGLAMPLWSQPSPQTAFTAGSLESVNLKVSRVEAVPIRAGSGLEGLFSCWRLGEFVVIVVWDFF